MTRHENPPEGLPPESPRGKEILVPPERLLRHIFSRDRESPINPARFFRLPAKVDDAPVFGGKTYFANIASEIDPLLLELRFEPIEIFVSEVWPAYSPPEGSDEKARIALLMTNERFAYDLEIMGREIYRRVKQRDIVFDAVVAPEILGPKLAREVAKAAYRLDKREVYITTLQKGRPMINKNGTISVGPPKPWVDKDSGIAVSSGTSRQGSLQRMYLDQAIAARMRQLKMKVLLVDDARLTQGTIDSGIRLLQRMKLPIAGIATVLNEGSPVDNINCIPFVWLTKLPLFMPVPNGLQPIPGTYKELRFFYQEVPV